MMRGGYTTGTCAAAAAKAAALILRGETPTEVDVPLPDGTRATLAVESHARGDGWAQAAVR
jgi:cobalt-precorrin-5B (C1)-methyltransferase